jgi:hypothetical protein
MPRSVKIFVSIMFTMTVSYSYEVYGEGEIHVVYRKPFDTIMLSLLPWCVCKHCISPASGAPLVMQQPRTHDA